MMEKKGLNRKDLMLLLESLTPGGSEYYNDPLRCADFVKQQFRQIPHTILPFKRENDRLKGENEVLKRALEVIIEKRNSAEWDSECSIMLAKKALEMANSIHVKTP